METVQNDVRHCPQCGELLDKQESGVVCTNELCGFTAAFYDAYTPIKATSAPRLMRVGDSQVIVTDVGYTHNRTGEACSRPQQVVAVTPERGGGVRIYGTASGVTVPRSALPLLIQALQNEAE